MPIKMMAIKPLLMFVFFWFGFREGVDFRFWRVVGVGGRAVFLNIDILVILS
jgi:hypothetical protein